MALREKPFSFTWMLVSMGVFVGVELILGGLVGTYLTGRYMSHNLSFMLQGLLNLSSYFLGGLLVGVISPGIRIREPATGAALAIGAMFTLTVFTPYSFMRFSGAKLIIGGVIAYVLALSGARIGEKLTGNL
jgi:hypothetical protein